MPFAPGGFNIASLACGGVLRAVEAVLSGEVAAAYALVRPPGHHAERDRGRGFCLVNNVAVAALHARQYAGLQRVAIVDWYVPPSPTAFPPGRRSASWPLQAGPGRRHITAA